MTLKKLSLLMSTALTYGLNAIAGTPPPPLKTEHQPEDKLGIGGNVGISSGKYDITSGDDSVGVSSLTVKKKGGEDKSGMDVSFSKDNLGRKNDKKASGHLGSECSKDMKECKESGGFSAMGFGVEKDETRKYSTSRDQYNNEVSTENGPVNRQKQSIVDEEVCTKADLNHYSRTVCQQRTMSADEERGCKEGAIDCIKGSTTSTEDAIKLDKGVGKSSLPGGGKLKADIGIEARQKQTYTPNKEAYESREAECIAGNMEACQDHPAYGRREEQTVILKGELGAEYPGIRRDRLGLTKKPGFGIEGEKEVYYDDEINDIKQDALSALERTPIKPGAGKPGTYADEIDFDAIRADRQQRFNAIKSSNAQAAAMASKYTQQTLPSKTSDDDTGSIIGGITGAMIPILGGMASSAQRSAPIPSPMSKLDIYTGFTDEQAQRIADNYRKNQPWLSADRP